MYKTYSDPNWSLFFVLGRQCYRLFVNSILLNIDYKYEGNVSVVIVLRFDYRIDIEHKSKQEHYILRWNDT